MFLIVKKWIVLTLKKFTPLIARLLKVQILNKDQTLSFLKYAEINNYRRISVELEPVEVFGDTNNSFWKKDIVRCSHSAVYCISSEELKVLPYGGIQKGSKVLDLDFGSLQFMLSGFKMIKRKKKNVKNCIVLWSHNWGGYYDYLFFIYAKLLRIKEVMGEEEFKQSIVLYPLFGKSFERELLKIAGLEENQVYDVKNYTVEAVNYYFANNDSWFYPSIKDIKNLQKISLSLTTNKSSEHKRIYISRKHRRILSNEAEIIKVLQDFDFQIIKDEARTIKEQMEIYSSAEIVLGPHGASFSNILWCRPNTVLIELFSNQYYPPYFKYLANVLGLKYYAIIENNVGVSDDAYSYKNIFISPEVIRSSLRKILLNQKVSPLKAL
jgi:hypothetical protein